MAALLALLAAVGWGSSDYAAGSASRRSSAVSVVILTHLAAVVALVCFAVDFGPVWAMFGDLWDAARPSNPLRPIDTTQGIDWSGPAIGGRPANGDLVWGLAAGLGGGLGAMLLFRGLGKGSMAVVAPITATGAAAIPALYGVATGEAVTFAGVLGIGLALIAIVLVSLTGESEVTEAEVGEPDATEVDLIEVAAPTRDLVVAGRPLTPPGDAALTAALPAPRPASGGQLAPPAPPAPPAPALAAAARVATLDPPTPVAARRAAPPPFPPPPVAPVPPPPPPARGSAAPAVAWSAHGVPSEGESSAGDRDAVGEIRMSLRRMRATIVSLTVAALLAAAVAAAGPIGAIVAGDGPDAGGFAALALAAVVVGLALSAANAAKLLFQVQAARPAHIERRTDPPSFDGRDDRVERRLDASSFRLRSILRQPGVPEALLSGVGFGAFFVFIAQASESAGHWPLVSARAISVVMFAIAALVSSTALLPERGSRRFVVLAGLLDAAAAVFFVLSTRAGLLSVGAVLASLYPVVTVLLARFVGGERIRRRQFAGLVLAVGAVSLLAI